MARNNIRERIIQLNGCKLKISLLEGTPPNDITIATLSGLNAVRANNPHVIQNAINNRDIAKIHYNWFINLPEKTL
ncbi:MAG: hypothetical protein J5I47_07790 [Vicingus serpentipes]|nr:hypothetical protein [Vicingus serpentipes]